MKIEVWSDFACPICFLGIKTLQVAIDCFGKDKAIEIEYKSFQLEPNFKSGSTDKVMDVLQRRYELSIEKRQVLYRDIIEKAKQIGMDLHVKDITYTNAYDAHRLVKFAQKIGKEKEVTEAIFDSLFLKRQNISEKSTLLLIAREVGLDQTETEMLLSFNKYEKAVLEDQMEAKEIGIEQIPFLIFNDKYAISGSQPVSVYMDILEDILKEDPNCFQKKKSTKQHSYCIGKDCE